VHIAARWQQEGRASESREGEKPNERDNGKKVMAGSK